MEKEKEENIWKRDIFFVEEMKTEQRVEENIMEKEKIFCGGEGKYLAFE